MAVFENPDIFANSFPDGDFHLFGKGTRKIDGRAQCYTRGDHNGFRPAFDHFFGPEAGLFAGTAAARAHANANNIPFNASKGILFVEH